ncbi:MAG: GNAT family N-acetyltransferase [Verrucomicrobia bacterium]|nr:GNAT family N-acetyltransferase [Verrucomicrobiota bacterium]
MIKKVVSKQYGLPDPWSFRPPAGIRLVDVRTIEELDQHAQEWNDLFQKADRLTPMLSFPWMRAFFKHQVTSPERWLCLFAYENDRLIGIMPLMSSYAFRALGLSLRLFKLPYHYAHTSGTDCIAAPGQEHVFGLFMDYLNSLPLSIPCLSLKHLPDHYPSVRYLNAGKHKLSFVQKSAGTEAFIPLPGTAEAYTAGLSGKLRQNLRRAARDLEKLPDVQFRFRENTRSAQNNTARFLEVESRNWKGERETTIRNFPGSAEVFEEAAAGFTAQNLMAFSFLESGDRSIAAHYAMRNGRILYILKMAYDEEFINCSPGNLLMIKVIETVCDSGDFDEINYFSDPPILAKWNVQHRPIWHLIVFPKIPLLSPLLRMVIGSGKVHNFDIPL